MNGPSGFASSPVTQSLLILIGCASIGVQYGGASAMKAVTLDIDAIKSGQIWRLLTSQLIFLSPSDLILGIALLYMWRTFERQFGSRKYASAVLVLSILSVVVQCCVLLGVRSLSPSTASSTLFASGPYAIIFGLLACFVLDVPQSTPFKLCGIPLSDKLFVYILALQLALATNASIATVTHGSASSVVSATNYGSGYASILGFVLGLLYRIDSLRIHRIRIPSFIARCCHRVFTPLLSPLESFASTRASNHAGRVGGSGRSGGGPQAVGMAAARGQMAANAAAASASALAASSAASASASASSSINNNADSGFVAPSGPTRAGGYQMIDNSDADDAARGATAGGDVLIAPASSSSSAASSAYAPLPLASVSSSAVQQLVMMGFDAEQSRQALAAAHNNVEMATNIMIGS